MSAILVLSSSRRLSSYPPSRSTNACLAEVPLPVFLCMTHVREHSDLLDAGLLVAPRGS